MGDWYEYFEDFPEENPANWIDGRYDPVGAKRFHQQQSAHEKSQEEANAELTKLINDAKTKTKARSLLIVEDCPQCGLNTLNTYRINDRFYLCECQDCGIYGNGKTHQEALKRTEEALGDGLDWREGSLY